jgi:DNA mismatch endonuclease (patch repair protein)
MDSVTKDKRSEIMGKVRHKDTRPEMLVRRLVHGLGFRYRLHRTDLPGKPDLVFSGKRKIIFVHGCFWHRHEGCKLARMPKSRIDFWQRKLTRNKERDRETIQELQATGWDVLVVWECETNDIIGLTDRIVGFLKKDDKDYAERH